MKILLCGQDSVVLIGRNLTDFAPAGNFAELRPQGDIVDYQAGKNGNIIVSKLKTGDVHELKIRLLVGSSDDKFLYYYYNLLNQGVDYYVPFFGMITKRTGDGKGNVSEVNYNLTGLTFTEQPTFAILNVNGDVEVAINEYRLKCVVERLT